MKKIVTLVFSMLLTVGAFTGCGKDDTKENKSSSLNDNSSEVVITTVDEETEPTTESETIAATEEPTTEEATEPQSLSIVPGGKSSGKNIVPGLKLGMKKDEVFDSMEIEFDEEEPSRDGGMVYYYYLDSIELLDINECASFYVQFDSADKLVLYGYHIGYDNKSDSYILSHDQLSSCYEQAYSEFVGCFGDPAEEETNEFCNIGNVRWLDTEIGDVSIMCGTDMWGAPGINQLMISVEGEIIENIESDNNDNSVDITDDDLNRIEKAFRWSSFPATKNSPSSPSIQKALDECFKEYDISVSSFSSDLSFGYYEYEVTVSGRYYKSVEDKDKRITDTGSIHFIVLYSNNELSQCTVTVDDLNSDVYDSMADIMVDFVYYKS